MQFLINLNTASYLHLFYENANGKVVQLIPSILQMDNRYPAGDFIAFPPEDGNIQLSVSPPFGKERLWIAACDKKITLNPTHTANHLNGFSLPLNTLSKTFEATAKNNSSTCTFDDLNFSTAP